MNTNPNTEAEKVEETLDALLDFFRENQKDSVKIINPTNYYSLLKTAAELTDLLRKTMPDGELEISIDDFFNSGAITVEFDLLTIYEPDTFAKIIQHASNVEIYPLTNGRAKMDLTFQSVLKTL